MTVRIVAKAERLGDTIFGTAYLSASGEGRYSDIFYHPIEGIERDSNPSLPLLLGHLITHELGHLLLGSNAHAVSGIMRAKWQQQEMRQLRMGTLGFSPQQSRRMRSRMEERARRATLSGGVH